VSDAIATKSRLIQTERLAAIGRMAAHVTHEVRNPLSSIGLNVDMLGDEIHDTGPESKRLMESIQQELERLESITEEYLRLARLDVRCPTSAMKLFPVFAILFGVFLLPGFDLAHALPTESTVELDRRPGPGPGPDPGPGPEPGPRPNPGPDPGPGPNPGPGPDPGPDPGPGPR